MKLNLTQQEMEDIIGILPAAGIGSRLRLNCFPKELLPIGLRMTRSDGEVIPSLIIDHSLQAFAQASIKNCWVIISSSKTEIVRYLANGEEFDIHLAYLTQSQPRGLAHAVDQAFPWIRDKYVCLALPDTVFEPVSAVATLRKLATETRADLVLGLFPTTRPEQLGPVELGPDNRVITVLDKPVKTSIKNTWGISLWSPRFTRLLHEFLASESNGASEIVLGNVFQMAVDQGLNVQGVFFEDGMYLDIGTPEGVASILRHRLNL